MNPYWCYVFVAHKQVRYVSRTLEGLYKFVTQSCIVPGLHSFNTATLRPIEDVQQDVDNNLHAFLDIEGNYEVTEMPIID